MLYAQVHSLTRLKVYNNKQPLVAALNAYQETNIVKLDEKWKDSFAAAAENWKIWIEEWKF